MNNPDTRVLIYGPRKGGTTLLQRLIDGGEIYVYPTELKMKWFARASSEKKDHLIDQYKNKNKLKNESHFGFDNNLYLEIFRKKTNAVRSLRDLIEIDLAAAIECSPKPVFEYQGWAVKEVGGDVDQIFSEWKKMFPDSKILMIVRNPLLVSRAVFRQRRRNSIRLSLRKLYKQAVDPWIVLLKQSKYIGRKDTLIISYEQLVSETSVVMKKVCEFLSINYSEVFCKPTLFGKEVIVRTSSKKTTSVFQDNPSFWNDLSLKEIISIICAAVLYGLVIRILLRHAPSYAEFSKAISKWLI